MEPTLELLIPNRDTVAIQRVGDRFLVSLRLAGITSRI